MWHSYQPYVSMAQRAAKAQAEIEKMRSKGSDPQPISVEGKKLAKQFWGKAWNDHIKQYSDLHNRLEKGRSYILNNLVIDFSLAPGKVEASVMGSSVYFVEVKIATLQPSLWESIKARCAGQIGSLIDLLSGKLADDVMSVITQPTDGLFPVGKQMTFKCSCPDASAGWMCKHVAATLYGVGVRIDNKPEDLFVLRGVDHLDLISAATAVPTLPGGDPSAPVLSEDALADVFGIELEGSAGPAVPGPAAPPMPETMAAPTPIAAAVTKAGKGADRKAAGSSSAKSKGKPAAMAKAVTKPPLKTSAKSAKASKAARVAPAAKLAARKAASKPMTGRKVPKRPK